MKIDKEKIRNIKKAFLSIFIGTFAGVATYIFFLYFKIAILGWNLGLLFAPLVAGYVETYIARKLIGDGIGAISAFILFIITVIYGFIIANPTLGFNIITVGSIIVIIQAAMPTAINYLLIVPIVGTLSYLTGFFKEVTDKLSYNFRIHFGKTPRTVKTVEDYEFDEKKSNERINSRDFYYTTTSSIPENAYENIGYFYTTFHIKRDPHLVTADPEITEMKRLRTLKTGKDKCLIQLANKIQKSGGNGVLNLEINYFLNGLGGSYYQIVAHGMGIRIKEPDPTS